MNTKELLKLSGIETSDDLPEVKGVALKANEVKEAFIFAALKGAQKDGADFVPEAVKNGAALVLAEHEVDAPIPVLVVPGLREKVSRLASLMYVPLRISVPVPLHQVYEHNLQTPALHSAKYPLTLFVRMALSILAIKELNLQF